jgi:hypothetical protein
VHLKYTTSGLHSGSYIQLGIPCTLFDAPQSSGLRERVKIMITVPYNPPREPARFKDLMDFKNGLRVYYFFGSFFSLATVMLMLSAFLPPHEAGLIIFKIIAGVGLFGTLSFILLRTAAQRHRKRLQAFRKGMILEGTVTKHGRKFVFWKSSRDYTVTVEILLDDNTTISTIVQGPDGVIHKKNPLQSKIPAFVDTTSESVFIPAEIGVEIHY